MQTRVQALMILCVATVSCGGSPTSPRESAFTVRIHVTMYSAPLRYPLLQSTPLNNVRIETIGGPAPGVLATQVLDGRYHLELPSNNYDGQMVRLSLDGYQSYEARLGGNAFHSYFLKMNPSPHVLTGWIYQGTAGVDVEILDGVNAGRKTVTYAHGDDAAYVFEGLLSSPPFRLRVGTRVYAFEGQSHPPNSDILPVFRPVRGLYHHSEFDPQ